MSEKPISVGGQAVIEGVMMRSPTYYATAVRTPQGTIVIQKTRFEALTHRFKFLNIPILRGAIGLVEMMWIGISSLSYSASQAADEDSDPKPKKNVGTNLTIFGSVVFALGMGFLLFFLLPLWLTELTGVQNGIGFNLIDGAIRLVFFLGYLFLIAQWKDMQRIFQYHGAEHKTIYVYENKQDLTVANARPYTTLHPRCGTSFLLVVMLVSILVFSVLGKPDTWGERMFRFAMIPVIGGISFEFIRLSAKERFARFLKPAVWPGLTLQKVTTREPSDDMLEVAIAALNACLDYQNVRLEIPSS
ncbi:MAG: DUF1385 domain-containing protein [Candidatus Krumholzibacteria bacterium]|nr:DUF1385 domain-containing protein [Candidatus Krumholzibacteria bacterium]MDH5271140.1 DUF1385 domain-containing protein [Candidatus Krumholzibacteria bacterium]